jgi:hypothetical protein
MSGASRTNLVPGVGEPRAAGDAWRVIELPGTPRGLHHWCGRVSLCTSNRATFQVLAWNHQLGRRLWPAHTTNIDRTIKHATEPELRKR